VTLDPDIRRLEDELARARKRLVRVSEEGTPAELAEAIRAVRAADDELIHALRLAARHRRPDRHRSADAHRRVR